LSQAKITGQTVNPRGATLHFLTELSLANILNNVIFV